MKCTCSFMPLVKDGERTNVNKVNNEYTGRDQRSLSLGYQVGKQGQKEHLKEKLCYLSSG